jgi:DNA-directed RNA polymerase specialized sigma24 family protein
LVDPATVDETERVELLQTVEWAPAKLPPKQRAAIVRRIFDAAPDRVSALELDTSQSGVPNQRHRGMQPLRLLLQRGA